MSIFDKISSAFGKKSESASAQDAESNPDDLIKVFDAYGREMYVTREVWRTQVLANQLKADWADPNKLYTLIVSSLHDGFHQDVLDASAQLLRIDPNHERSHVARAIVLMQNGRLDEAERVLQSYIRECGATGTILTNLAKVHAARNEDEKAERTLWQALELDPNQDNGLGWFAAIHNERGGKSEYLEAMKKGASIAGSWRPQLWLARNCLDEGKIKEAREYYKHVLALASYQPGVLMMISGDLGKRGYLTDIFDLILPVYSPERHDVMAGINLLQAFLETKKFAEGEKLLHKLFELNRPDIKQHLMFYSEQFEKLKASAEKTQPAISEPLEISAMLFTYPIWAYGLKQADWLFADSFERKRKIGFLVLANTTQMGISEPQQQREDDAGRLTRSIPLFLAERLHFMTDALSQTIVPVVKEGGPVVSGVPWSAEHIKQMAEGNSEMIVTGAIKASGESYDITLELWDVDANRQVQSFKDSAPSNAVGKVVLRLSEELFAYLAREQFINRVTQPTYYVTPKESLIDAYLSALGQSLSLTLVENGLMSSSSLWGERNMLNWFLNLSLEMADAQIPKILFLSGLAKNKAYGSEIYKEFKDLLLKLIADEKNTHSPFYRLSPLAYRTLYMDEEFRVRKKELYISGGEQYRAWLDRL